MLKVLEILGNFTIKLLENLGKFAIFEILILRKIISFRIKEIIKEIKFIGYDSLGIIFLTSFFTGLVEAIQLYNGFHKFGVEDFMGYTIFLSVVKELSPVFTTLMVISRGISAYTAELGSMRVTEQIDAIEVMAVDSIEYLIVPKILATIISLPFLILFFDAISNVSAYLISIYYLEVNPYAYLDNIQLLANIKDIIEGVIKGIVFGYFISTIGTYIGYHTKGGAKGVGESTTKAVVISSVSIFMLDYILSFLFLVF